MKGVCLKFIGFIECPVQRSFVLHQVYNWSIWHYVVLSSNVCHQFVANILMYFISSHLHLETTVSLPSSVRLLIILFIISQKIECQRGISSVRFWNKNLSVTSGCTSGKWFLGLSTLGFCYVISQLSHSH